jgi:hypothetical protein
LLIAPAPDVKITDFEISEIVNDIVKAGIGTKEAASEIANRAGISKKEAYNQIINNKDR